MIKKKLYIGSILLCFVFIVTIFTACGSSKKDNKSTVTVKLNEVARSVFYAPMYVAVNEGFFKEQGISIDLTTGQGADVTPTKAQEGIILEVTPSYRSLGDGFIAY
ncbi:ABC transporter substrate-binding protein [Clostridium sp. WILCCON 0269]|uniref:ABC transporter substrate-binding protein n=1 Tax=Candidatus Clostridium eludens TaxID=3381663 RepID=A0ABW8SH43_9CLOT